MKAAGGNDKGNKALARYYINLLIATCLLDEDLSMKKARSKSSNEKIAVLIPHLFFETPLSELVRYDGQPRPLTGFADYTIGHDKGNTMIWLTHQVDCFYFGIVV